MKKLLSRKSIVRFVVLLLMMLTLASGLSLGLKISVCVVLAGVYFFSKRDEGLFNRALTLIQQGNVAEAIVCFRKAYELGLDSEKTLAVGSVLVQYGYPEEGLGIVRNLLQKQLEPSLKNKARIVLSVGFWNCGDAEKAIETLMELVDEGYEDESVVATLCVYLLVKQRYAELKRLLPEKQDYELVSTGMLDNYLWLYIAQNQWEKAELVAMQLSERELGFPEAYYHLALVALHKRRVKEAKDNLESALSKPFMPSAVIRQDFVEALHRILTETKNSQALLMNLDDKYERLSRADRSVLEQMRL